VETPCPRISDTAYVRTANDGGLVQFWTAAARRECLFFHQQLPGTDDLDDALETTLLETALNDWMFAADACAAPVCLQLGASVDTTEPFGYVQDGTNRNVVLVVRDLGIWRELGEPSASLAVTLTTYDQYGRLLDADIALNDAGHLFSADPKASEGSLDFASTLLHELGHALGFAHSPDDEAVMWYELRPGETRRVLSPTDRAGICEAYGCR
jgi:hypothetical protein